MPYLRGLVQYCGANYNGWQIQSDAATIQGVLQDVIGSITGEKAEIMASGRTDAGVHALGQVISFHTSSSIDLDTLKRAINALLPSDIVLQELSYAREGFHPRFDAKMKTYLYLVHLGQQLSPFIAPFVWHIRYSIDIDAIKSASRQLIGIHDFAAFMGSGSDVKDTVRTIYQIEICLYDEVPFVGFNLRGNIIGIEITANGFLRHMVRNIVGTFIDIGRGFIPEEDMVAILKSRDRKRAGLTAPANGLFLKRVCYEPK